MRVLLADDHAKVRQALRMFLEEEPGMSIVGEVAAAVPLVDQVRALRPDIILLEWALQGQSGNTLLRALRALDPAIRVIVLSSRPEYEQAALAAGANDFVGKANGPEQLLAVLRRLMEGEG